MRAADSPELVGKGSDQGKYVRVGPGNQGVRHPPAFALGFAKAQVREIVRRRRSTRAGKGRTTTSEATRTKGAAHTLGAPFLARCPRVRLGRSGRQCFSRRPGRARFGTQNASVTISVWEPIPDRTSLGGWQWRVPLGDNLVFVHPARRSTFRCETSAVHRVARCSPSPGSPCSERPSRWSTRSPGRVGISDGAITSQWGSPPTSTCEPTHNQSDPPHNRPTPDPEPRNGQSADAPTHHRQRSCRPPARPPPPRAPPSRSCFLWTSIARTTPSGGI